MTSASNPIITRCPKCGTAFRVTPSQLQSAKGAVRCGSCLNVFKAEEYLVAVKPKTPVSPDAVASTPPVQPPEKLSQISIPETPAIKPSQKLTTPAQPILQKPEFTSARNKTAHNNQSEMTPMRTPTIKLQNLDDSEDVLISDDMEEIPTSSNKYEFDSFMELDVKPAPEVSLFERKNRPETEDRPKIETDESWAEMLIDDEEATPILGVARPKSTEELADEALHESFAVMPDNNQPEPPTESTLAAPGLKFSLVGEVEQDQSAANETHSAGDELVFSEEITKFPSHQGFKSSAETAITQQEANQPSATPDEERRAATDGLTTDENNKRQVKTQPKIRAYDGSRTALLMNIIPAPIEFTSKRMRRWYQRKLWSTLSLVGIFALAAQIAWFKFETLSRIEPYRTGYLFACPYFGCEVPTLIDTSQIKTSNLVVREHPITENALAVDVMVVNSAAFEQPFPDLMLIFSDLDNNLVASRRFTPKDYLGGELAGADLMPQNQKVYITLDIVDPGAEAVNYRIYIP